MNPEIQNLHALEILDSRGRPTLQVTCALANGSTGVASVPSGASTGAAEALELRDGDSRRYGGLGCRKAVAQVNQEIQTALQGNHFKSQEELDQRLIELDGTPNKSRLGTNAILGVSLAFARAMAVQQSKPLYGYLADMIGSQARILPIPLVNLFSGGVHAGRQVAIQDLQIIPVAAASMDQALATVYAVYQAAAQLCTQKYGTRLLRADEGGQAPPFSNSEEMLSTAVEAIQNAGFKPGLEVRFAMDVAASHFYRDGRYHIDNDALNSQMFIDRLEIWLEEYPITSLEDALAEEDWEGWHLLSARLGKRAILIGDDFLCTNPLRIRKAIDQSAANGLLLKVNQIGTLSEAAQACQLARLAGWKIIASARSGETEDNWLADLAVGWSAEAIKIGSITQSERLAKYNRLLEIEQKTGYPMERF
jgi:enolase